MNESDNTTETCDERPGHRILADDYVIDLCDFSSITISEEAVRPMRDMDAEEPIDNEIEKDAVRPKSDMDAEEPIDNEIEKDAVRPMSDDDAVKSAVDEDAKNNQEKNKNEATAATKNLETMMKFLC